MDERAGDDHHAVPVRGQRPVWVEGVGGPGTGGKLRVASPHRDQSNPATSLGTEQSRSRRRRASGFPLIVEIDLIDLNGLHL